MDSTHEPPKSRMITVFDPFLKVWWSFMNNDDKIIIQKHIGYLLSMLEMNVWPDLIRNNGEILG